MSQRRRIPISSAVAALRDQVLASTDVQIVYLVFDRFPKVEEIFGWEKLDRIIALVDSIVPSILDGTPIRNCHIVSQFENDEDMVLIVYPPANIEIEALNQILRALRDNILSAIESKFGSSMASLIDVHMGATTIQLDARVRLDRQIYRGIRAAQFNAKSVDDLEGVRELEDLRETLRSGSISCEYQPIVSAATGEIFGYESLARGSIRSMVFPEVMFEVAAKADLVWELSRLCRSTAIMGASTLLSDNEVLFLNIDPYDFFDPGFTPDTLGQEKDPGKIVLEITERTAIKNYPIFKEYLQAFRDRGYRFAVDDAGSGYAGLGSIANLEPDFIKLDLSIISEIDSNFIKQDLVSGIVKFANDQNAQVIAEGIERVEELDTVKRLGVHYVQGYYFQHLDQRS